jgi:hypothetical protein
VEPDAVPQPELERIERLGSADLVVGILDGHAVGAANAAAAVREALAPLSNVARTVLICCDGTQGSAEPANSEGSGAGESLTVFSFGPMPAGASRTTLQSMSNAYRSVFVVSGKLGARACGVIATDLQSDGSQRIRRLVQPVVDLAFDLVAPRYTRHKMEGLLNRSILSPLHRALYGVQLQNPMGPDFGLSGRLLQRVLGQGIAPGRGSQVDLVGSIAATAASDGFQICESHLGARTQPPTDWLNLSSLLAEVLGPVFLEMERQAAFWQGIRGSKPAPQFGLPLEASDDDGTMDVNSMIESFHLGAQNLQDVWGLALPPTTLLELRKLSRLPADRFRVPDELWARIVYDFALGHRLRAISSEHLLRSITPLYLGWIASFALEVKTAGEAQREAVLERLCKAYEANKAYLVSRWRWPDRFNP